jgi:hypothetical protein
VLDLVEEPLDQIAGAIKVRAEADVRVRSPLPKKVEEPALK